MEDRLLIAFASTHGATQEIAEFIGAALRERGWAADVQPARSVRTLEGYSAVVLGAPLYMFRWHGDAKRFLGRHQKAIAGGVPVAVFGSGPFGEPKPEEWQAIRASLDKELANFAWFRPAAVEIMGGKFDPARLRFPYNLIPAMKSMPPSDLRDWDAIRAWAEAVAEQLARREPAAA